MAINIISFILIINIRESKLEYTEELPSIKCEYQAVQIEDLTSDLIQAISMSITYKY